MPKFIARVYLQFRDLVIEADTREAALDEAWKRADDFLDEAMCPWDAEVTDTACYEVTT